MLIGINVVVFLLINLVDVFGNLLFVNSGVSGFAQQYLALPSYLPTLLKHFWTPLTYMFMHSGIFHILFNMLWLYWMGQIFEEFLGNKRTLGLYLIGGFTGAALFVICYNIFPMFTQTGLVVTSTAVGASAAVMAIIAGAATIVPDYTVVLFGIFPIKLKWIAIFYVAMGFLGMSGPNAGGEIAHIGGALAGFVYVKQLQSGKDWIASIAGLFKPKPKLRVASTNRDKAPSGAPRQEEVDRILDKISTTGYDNLSKQEKDILFRASKK